MTILASQLSTPRSDSLWDFRVVYDVLETWHYHGSAAERFLDPPAYNPRATTCPASKGLGDFDRLYQFLGWTIDGTDSRTPHSSDLNESPSNSTGETPPSSQSDPRSSPEKVKGKEVRWEDELQSEIELAINASHERSNSRARRKYIPKNSPGEIRNSADFESEAEDQLRLPFIEQPQLWVPPPMLNLQLDPQIIQPLETLTFNEKKAKLLKKLKRKNKLYNTAGSEVSAAAIHVFVDCSNIVIGFYDALKLRRGLNRKAYTKQAPISWQLLTLILERGRAVARRVLVGSHGTPFSGQMPRIPDYMLEAEKCGYELNILERVLKHKNPTPVKKRGGSGNGYATSGHSSSDGGYITPKVVTEQGVDEILQMKLLESLVDTKRPSTIVLASGDAAEAEYSGGFLKSVERALAKGWKVELVAWSFGLSQEYRSSAFLRKWKDSFTIIELDDYSEDLLALYPLRMAAPRNLRTTL